MSGEYEAITTVVEPEVTGGDQDPAHASRTTWWC